MRFVPTINPPTAAPTTRAVKGLVSVHSVKPIHEEVEPTSVTLSSEAHQQQSEQQQSGQQQSGQQQSEQQYLPQEDRRKACRRFHNQKVLIELRSGHDRRQHNLMEGGVADHIDEEA